MGATLWRMTIRSIHQSHELFRCALAALSLLATSNAPPPLFPPEYKAISLWSSVPCPCAPAIILFQPSLHVAFPSKSKSDRQGHVQDTGSLLPSQLLYGLLTCQVANGMAMHQWRAVACKHAIASHAVGSAAGHGQDAMCCMPWRC